MRAAAAVACFATAASAAGQPVTLDERLAILAETYPGMISAREPDALVMKSGARIAIDDGREKDHPAKLVDADIEDMLAQVYPIGRCDTGEKPARNFEPGRIRSEVFFRAVYGNSEQAVEANLASLPWFGKRIPVTRTLGVDQKLAAVARDLAELPAKFHPVFSITAGTFKWRVIAGTDRLSVHSFAAAIDLNLKYADYWIWSGGKPGNVPKYRNKIPKTVIDVFERHGFIWGGKWYHYDTMHFEYRPELIAIGRLAEARGCGG